MFAVTVALVIKPEAMEAFMRLMKENAKASLTQEPLCHQFDICTDPSDPNSVFLYELYASRAAFDAHLATAHFRSFNAATVEMIESRQLRCFESVVQ